MGDETFFLLKWVITTSFVFAVASVSTAAGVSGTEADVLSFQFTESELRRITRMSPLPELSDDPSNAMVDDKRAAEFGKLLFFDTRLSGDGKTSCATCHDPELNWIDGKPSSNPDARFPKNVPSLWNVAYNRWFFWDGRADSSWAQALGPMEQEDEMSSNRLRIIHYVRQDPELRKLYIEVYGSFPDELRDLTRFPLEARPVVNQPDHPLQLAWMSMTDADQQRVNVVFTNLGKAIAAFERRIVALDTVFDKFVAELKNTGGKGEIDQDATTFSKAAMRGLKIFVGRGNCTLCHSGPLLSDGEFHDVGIALGKNMRIDPGRHRGVLKLLRSSFNRIGNYADMVTSTAPVNFLDQQTHQLGQFKTPSLRGVADTAPYMHDGRFMTLEQVVRFYSTRDGALPLGHSTTLLQPLNLSDEEIADLVAFLEALSHSNVKLHQLYLNQ